jgi:hypothetical protein
MGDFLEDLSIYSVLLPFLAGLLLWKFQDANARIMVILLAFASFSQILGTSLKEYQSDIYNIYLIADGTFIPLIFFRNTRIRSIRILIFSLWMTLIITTVATFLKNGIHNRAFFDLICFDSAIQVICVLVYFYEKYYSEEIMALKEEPLFWFSLAILFYAPCTYFWFAYRNFFGKANELKIYHDILNILLYFIITIGLLVRVKKIKSFLQWI